MIVKHNQLIGKLADLPDSVSKLVQSLLQKSLGDKFNKLKFNFAYENDIPKRINQYKKQLKNFSDILPPVYKYELFFTYSDTNIKSYQIYIGIDEYLQIHQYTLPTNPEFAINGIYGEKAAIEIAVDYAAKNGYKTEIESTYLRYNIDKKILIWHINLLQQQINPTRKKCLTIEVDLCRDKTVLTAIESELVEETISVVEIEEDHFDPSLPPPPPKIK